MKIKFLTAISIFITLSLTAQQTQAELSFAEFLGYVKKYHPVVAQAQLKIEEGQATLMKARGGFDPKLEVDYDQKRFKGDEYFELLNTTFKIPTWYGIELKANFEQNEGVFLNPQNNVPENGLYGAGVKVPIGQGLFINDRMATLKQANIFRNLTQAQRDIEVNQALYEAANAYFGWYKAYQNYNLYSAFYENAQTRFKGIRERALLGDIPAIDTLEAYLILQNRDLSKEQSSLELTKKKLKLSNFLWLENNLPIELSDVTVPALLNPQSVDEFLGTDLLRADSLSIADHPKVKMLNLKVESLEVERRLKAENLKPRLDVEYNLLAQNAEEVNTYFAGDYKTSVRFSLPLFLRKERGDLKLAKLKVQDAKLDIAFMGRELENKINAGLAEIASYQKQYTLYQSVTENAERMLEAEERKFSFGESSVFLINSRESSLIGNRVKQVEALNKLLEAKAGLFNVLANEVNLPTP